MCEGDSDMSRRDSQENSSHGGPGPAIDHRETGRLTAGMAEFHPTIALAWNIP
jgi:hypothetical protein